jgi:mannose-binding lectin 2
MWLSSKLASALWLVAGLASAAWGADSSSSGQEEEIKSISLRTHSIRKPYLDSDMGSRWFDFGGDAIIRTDSYIRLTSDRPSQTGWLWSRVPLTATNWEIEVEFKIHGKNTLYGDGFAVWITKNRAAAGPVFGSADNFEGLGVFFDTYKNNRPGVVFPFVMAMYGDGKTSYDKNTDGKSTELAGCSARGIRNANIPTKFKLTYFQEKMLRLELQYKNEDDWTTCFETTEPPAIPQIAYLGFSAETGELSDNHDIISISSKNLYSASGQVKSAPGSSNRKKAAAKKGTKGYKKGSGSWSWFFMKIVFLLMAVGLSYVGYTAWRASKRPSRF